MGTIPAWCLFKIYPHDSVKVGNAFDEAIQKSKVVDRLDKYLKDRETSLSTDRQESKKFLDEFYPRGFDNIRSSSEIFTSEDFFNTSELFFAREFHEIVKNLKSLITPTSINEIILDLVMIGHRVGASQFLYAGLGWSRASRLPGSCGNMFIPPLKMEECLIDIEKIFEEIDEEDFFARAYAAGAEEDTKLEKFFFFPQLLENLKKDGNGLLAINIGDIGSFPFPDNQVY